MVLAHNPARLVRSRIKPLGFVNAETLSERLAKTVYSQQIINRRVFYETPSNHDGWKTHSGKTTFAKELESVLQQAIVIDQDNHAEFINSHYKKLLLRMGLTL